VSKAGGLGILGCLHRDPEEIAHEVELIRAATGRPFGINLVLGQCSPEQWRAAFAARPPVLSTSWGDVAPVMDRAKEAGCLVVHQVNTVTGAKDAVRAGVDAIIAQGSEGGGHVGWVSTMALVPQVVDVAKGIPVIAAGGIADGRGIAAAMALGADGVLLGTRFLATPEAPMDEGWKAALVGSPAELAVTSDVSDLIWDMNWPGATCRILRNTLVERWEGRVDELVANRIAIQSGILQAREQGEIAEMLLYAGQGMGTIHEIKPAGELVGDLWRETLAVLSRLSMA
ncbi:MAG: nitronate monooxygenase, partial [Chloroflexota bacterium]|nr:nitronate monooxygenase [Chloroflexota bacterium]